MQPFMGKGFLLSTPCLDSDDNGVLATFLGAFQGPGVQGKMQHGSAWWFNDNQSGMREQLINLAKLSILGN